MTTSNQYDEFDVTIFTVYKEVMRVRVHHDDVDQQDTRPPEAIAIDLVKEGEGIQQGFGEFVRFEDEKNIRAEKVG